LANFLCRTTLAPCVLECPTHSGKVWLDGDGDKLNDRLAVSRHRAILVCKDLQSRFNLDSSRVGTVALENRPPEGSSHTNWNGVVNVPLKVKG
jgi:hypothetical protein